MTRNVSLLSLSLPTSKHRGRCTGNSKWLILWKGTPVYSFPLHFKLQSYSNSQKNSKIKALKKKKKLAEWSAYTACYHVISQQEEGEIVIYVTKPKKVTQNHPKVQDSENACNLSAWWHKAMSNEWDQRTKFPQLQIILWHFCWKFSSIILVCVLFWSPLETGIWDR